MRWLKLYLQKKQQKKNNNHREVHRQRLHLLELSIKTILHQAEKKITDLNLIEMPKAECIQHNQTLPAIEHVHIKIYRDFYESFIGILFMYSLKQPNVKEKTREREREIYFAVTLLSTA